MKIVVSFYASIIIDVMMKSKKRIIQIREDDVTVIEVEIEKPFIDFYKKETGRSRVTERGLSDFINNMIKLHTV